MSSSLSRGGSLVATPFSWSGHVSADPPASSVEWLNKDVPDWPLQTGSDSAPVSVERYNSYTRYFTTFRIFVRKHSVVFRPALPFPVSSVASLVEGGAPSGWSACSLCSDCLSSVTDSFVRVEEVVGLG